MDIHVISAAIHTRQSPNNQKNRLTPPTKRARGVRTSRGTSGKLVEGNALAAGLDNAGTRRLGEAQRAHRHLRNLLDALVVGDSANEDNNLVGLALRMI